MVNKSSRKTISISISLLVIAVCAYSIWAVRQPVPKILPKRMTAVITSQAPQAELQWPAIGEAAIGYDTNGVAAKYGGTKPLPTASVAKLITALAVLSRKPLSLNQQGPTITLGPNDVALYNQYVAEQGSVVAVTSGEQISEYQVLQAMLLPSANNMADSLAIWTFGSLPAYSGYANTFVKQLGLVNTHVGNDASGFDPSTTSTASDLVKLGQLVIKNPVLAQITDQASATGIPNTSTIKNVNFLLGSHNIIGLKTGNSNQAGGVYLSASQIIIANKPVLIVTALLGAPTLYDALANSLPLITSAQTNFSSTSVVNANDVVGSYSIPWTGKTLDALATNSLQTEAIGGSVIKSMIHLQPISIQSKVGSTVGSVQSGATEFTPAQQTAIRLSGVVPAPDLWWRLLHG
jgi:D-alanyl-D-alanine carboxypeptidase (penicillin-binding protein 5/6)